MRYKVLWLGMFTALAVALVVGGEGSLAQPPGKKGDKFGKKGPPGGGVSVDQLVDRIMAYDKNGDGKISKDELPERMQHLIAMGDTNKDGFLDEDEIRKLAATLQSLVELGGAPGGKGPKGPKGPPPDGPIFAVEKRMGDLEQKLDVLISEMQELRQAMTKKGPKGPKGGFPPPDKN
jgi:hypothetical protein